MSEEYFCFEEISDGSKFYKECHDSNNRGKTAEGYSNINKVKQDVRLHEMEEQLEIAENRCNTLKDQLDHMKKLYQHKTEKNKCVKPHTKLTLVNSTGPSPKRNPVELKSTSKGSFVKSSPSLGKAESSVVTPVRQNSTAISTDNSGAAIQTINNILNGITDSVNRLSQIHMHIENDKPSSRSSRMRDSACGDDAPPFVTFSGVPRSNQSRKEPLPIMEEGNHNVTTENILQQSSTVISVKSKVNHKKRFKRRNQSNNITANNKDSVHNSTITINITNKKSLKSTAKHVEKRFKIEPVKMISKDSSSILSPKKSKKQVQRNRRKSRASMDRQRTLSRALTAEPDKLVEIYHNNAAKGSETEDSAQDLRKARSKEGKQQKSSSETVPSLPLDEPSDTCVAKEPQCPQPQMPVEHMYSTHNNTRLSPIEEHVYIQPTAHRTECYSMCSKNYELPTIASKMKQVAKSYLRRFNFHSIPFCAAKSTSPSHNIGINIQQVMSIIKTRQPITGISPTLAHNITLAAEKLQGAPFTAMVSSLGSRVGRSLCPLMKPNLNYQQLQEMAKEIPEETSDENTKQMAEEDMACGDRNAPIWSSDPTTQKNCTCAPQQGIGLQQVLSRYNTQAYSTTSTVSQLQYRARARTSKFYSAPLKFRTKTISITKQQQQQQQQQQEQNDKATENKFSGSLKGKEKNLKEVLTNLHDEFSYLNQQYDLLSKKLEELGPNADDETVKQLEQMERCLNNKEEEITMVMTLYKEVMALKKQVKTLKEKASIASLSLSVQQQLPPQYHPVQQYRYYNDTHTAVHLTKLLRQIQMYQEMNRIGRRN